jgi:hypothetical protein
VAGPRLIPHLPSPRLRAHHTAPSSPVQADRNGYSRPHQRTAETYNLYVASLILGSVTVSLSQDGGHTWANDVTSATVPGDDREWIATAGANGFYLSYHAIGAGDEIIVNQGQVVAGQPPRLRPMTPSTRPQTDIYLGTVEDNEIGNIAVDPATGDVYQVFVGCPPSATAIVTCSSFNTAYMAVGVPTPSRPPGAHHRSDVGLPLRRPHSWVAFNRPRSSGR